MKDRIAWAHEAGRKDRETDACKCTCAAFLTATEFEAYEIGYRNQGLPFRMMRGRSCRSQFRRCGGR